MGNCCATKENNPPPKPKPQEEPPKVIKQIKVNCKNPHFSLTFDYHSKKPVSYIINEITSKYPKIDLDNLALLRGNLEILDFNATLEEIGIFPGDHLKVQIIEKSNEVTPNEENVMKHIDESKNNSKLSGSLEDIAEEESTTKHEIGRVQPKKAGMRLKQDGMRDTEACKLWKTALLSPKSKQYLKLNGLDISSTNTTHDISLKEKRFLKHLPVQFNANGHSVTVDSDESFNADDKKYAVSHKERAPHHPTDFFRDLQGPFSALKQI
ncbi:unnamed protein product [Blepharisma stoltei]|uniref:Ubiquitin-like domain-containing protein n=1 Tax=Blepharisma stoltei TaxID=1481888 RepID=A0AAU9J4X5_9CILI|nr:unnamed protein product [Blepharisma stoltei]